MVAKLAESAARCVKNKVQCGENQDPPSAHQKQFLFSQIYLQLLVHLIMARQKAISGKKKSKRHQKHYTTPQKAKVQGAVE